MTDVDVSLREWNLNASGIQSVVDSFIGRSDIACALFHKDILLHHQIDTAVAETAQDNLDSVLLLDHQTAELIRPA